MRILAPGRIDTAIQQRLHARTAGVFDLGIQGINEGGPIVLTGRAGSYYAAQLALAAAQDVIGTHVEIHNKIAVTRPGQRRP